MLPTTSTTLSYKHILAALALLTTTIGTVAPARASDVYVHGYTRDNGTYVEPYHRSSPDSSLSNNYNYNGR